ncbi:uncharacterized protein LOC132729826 [Ruditapes philippinarum]|uniref:uncharacterized protein LOC132729826 n=1 Tax=Ruditapes philippinarum TaxID=129788 RepID=UPI00295B2940|nr:uncharacterized protein LOC132729826 [Ruditapes philippinarum]
MLKGWHDVVVDCGENPKKLLAAAFVNANTNYFAFSLLPKQQFDPNAEAKPATVELIQKISFSRTAYDHGDVFHDLPESVASYRPAGQSSFNVYGGDVTIGGLDIRQPQSSSSSNVASDSLDGSSSRATSFGSFNIHGGKVAISNMAIGPATQVSGFPSYNQSPTVRGEMSSIVPDFGKPQPGSFLSSGQPFKKENDDTLSQSMVAALGEQMKSVGALISAGNIIGTVFRVGTKYVMTASHVVSMVIDPHNTGNRDFSRLESDDTFINFNESVISPCVTVYRVSKEFIENKELDVAVLKIAGDTLSGLPMKMNLCVNDISEMRVTNVSLVGYGHPSGVMKKHLDPKCKIIAPDSDRLRAAHAFSQQNFDLCRAVIRENGGNPDIVNKGYLGYNLPSKLLFDCFMEHGASGGPALTNNNERSVQVVGLLTHGLPEFYFSLPDLIKSNFPNCHRLEAGTKMKDIFEWMRGTQNEYIVKDIFNL